MSPARTDILVQTKYAAPPEPTGTIARPRLLDVLDVGVEGALTLVTAPAGAGKTVLLSSWIATRRGANPVAWLSLDDGDADPRGFWHSVIESLRHAGARDLVPPLAAASRAPTELIVPALLDALDRQRVPIVLVLDDFQEVAPAVRPQMERLLRLRPPLLRIVILARGDPAIGLSRLRLDGRLTELRAEDLAFTREEAGVVLRQSGAALSDAEEDALWRRTEGWGAALRLATMSLRGHPDPARFVERFAGTDPAVSDYLVSEVLGRQPSDLRAFLLRTSIVDRVSAGLADAITGGSDGHRQLARLQHDGAVLWSADEDGDWHRYHPLFAELLRAELEATLGEEVQALHRRAATWFAAAGDDARALRHAGTGRAWGLVAELASMRWVELLIRGETSALQPALDHMPREYVDGSPELALAFAGALLERGDDAAADTLLRQAQADSSSLSPARRASFAAGLVATRLCVGRLGGDPAGALAAAREILGDDVVLAEDASPELSGLVLSRLGIAELWSGDLERAAAHLERAQAFGVEAPHDWQALIVAAHLALTDAFSGKIARAVREAEAAVAIAERRGWSRRWPTGVAFGALGLVALQRDRADDAQALLERADEALQGVHERSLHAIHALNGAMLLADRGEPEAALDVLRSGRDGVAEAPVPALLDDLLVAVEGALLYAVGEHPAARAMLERAASRSPSSLVLANALAELRLVDGDASASRAALATHLAPEETSGLVPRIEAWMLDALALDALAEHERASHSLEHALDLAEPAGLRRPIVRFGVAVRSLLGRQTRLGTVHARLVGEALEALGQRRRAGRIMAASPLSDHELVVLSYLPTMMTNQEIAGELFVSINTVKTHLKAVYRKLNVSNRRAAVRRARDLGLIS